jgi:hypothetical protein
MPPVFFSFDLCAVCDAFYYVQRQTLRRRLLPFVLCGTAFAFLFLILQHYGGCKERWLESSLIIKIKCMPQKSKLTTN